MNCIRKIFQKTWIIILIIMAISFLIRIWSLGKIGDLIFDEVYFVNFAKNYLNGVSFFDIHPPLGKLIIALGIKIFGDTSFTWRIMPAIFGTLLIGLGYLTGKELGGKIVGLFTALIFALDGMFLVYSRTGLIDIFLVFFIMLSFFIFLKYANTNKTIYLILAGISLGLCASVKYIGALVFLVFILIIWTKRIYLIKNLWKFILFLFILPIVVYTLIFLFNFHGIDFFSKFFEWHIQSFSYNLTLSEGHPYASKWWSWFLLLRPIWLYFKDIEGTFIGINGIGNPILWWSWIVVLPLLIWETFRKNKNVTIILGGFLIFLLFWAIFNRVLFMYHAIPAFSFLALGIGYFLEKLLKKPWGKLLVASYFLVALLIFLYFLPIWTGIPIESDKFYHRIWLKGWI